MNWIQRKIYLYHVTFGVYGLEWWEQYSFNTLVISRLGFIVYLISCFVFYLFKRFIHEARQLSKDPSWDAVFAF